VLAVSSPTAHEQLALLANGELIAYTLCASGYGRSAADTATVIAPLLAADVDAAATRFA